MQDEARAEQGDQDAPTGDLGARPDPEHSTLRPELRREALASAHLIVFSEAPIFKLAEPHYVVSRGYRLPVATADVGKLIGAATAVLRRIVQGRLVEQEQS